MHITACMHRAGMVFVAANVGVFIGCGAYGFLLWRLGPWKITLAGLILVAFCLFVVRNSDLLTLYRYHISFTRDKWNASACSLHSASFSDFVIFVREACWFVNEVNRKLLCAIAGFGLTQIRFGLKIRK